jgi:tetratricopeptide (TPR) repeat protein
MRLYLKQALTVSTVFLLTGCAAFGVPYTSDPGKKLSYAYMLMDDQCRPLAAERLIGEALDSYRANGDEIGMAEAYHTFGNLYKFNCYHTKWEKYLLETMGSHEKAYERSRENFQKAADLYEKHKDLMGASRSYFGIGNVYGIQEDQQRACALYDKSLALYNEGKAQDPNARINILTGFKDVPTMIQAFKNKSGC